MKKASVLIFLVFFSVYFNSFVEAAPSTSNQQAAAYYESNCTNMPKVLRAVDAFVKRNYPNAMVMGHWYSCVKGWEKDIRENGKWNSMNLVVTWDGYIILSNQIIGEWINILNDKLPE